MTVYREPDPIDPEGDTSNLVPPWWTAGAQVKQFGVGACSTLGAAPSVVNGLANPPAAMTEAVELLYPTLDSDA